jgi:hypothetical protein
MKAVEFKYDGFKLCAFGDGTPINLIIFDKHPTFILQSLYSKDGNFVYPGQKITGLLCNKTSAGFGSLNVYSGFLEYKGMAKVKNEILAVFKSDKSDRPLGYIYLPSANIMDPGCLFYLNHSGSGRIIEIDMIMYYKGP